MDNYLFQFGRMVMKLICVQAILLLGFMEAHSQGYFVKPHMQVPDSLIYNMDVYIVLTVFVDDEGKIAGWQLCAIDTWNIKKNRPERLYEENRVWYYWNFRKKRFEPKVHTDYKLTNTEIGKKMAIKLLPWLADYVNHMQYMITDPAKLKRRKEQENGKYTMSYSVIIDANKKVRKN